MPAALELSFRVLPRSIGLLAVALIPTLLNALQPLVADDPVYYEYARNILQRPFDPYGDGRMDTLVAPLLPYWGAATMALFGFSIPLLKLALFPFAVLLTFGIDALARRFAAGLENIVVAMAVISPWVLPGFNFMLDVPAYGLGITALALFVAGCDRGSYGRVVVAGLLAGLAIETKYNLATIPAAMFVYALIHRRYAEGLLACALAAAVFIGCEALLMAKYGHSHFLFHLKGRGSVSKYGALAYSIVGYGGAFVAALIPLGLLAMGVRRRLVVAALVACSATVLAIVLGYDDRPAAVIGIAREKLPTLAHLSGLLGLVLIAVLSRLLAQPKKSLQDQQVARFLVVWLAIEIIGCLVISPWPAARRCMGIMFVVVLIVCHAMHLRLQAAAVERGLIAAIAALTVVSGLGLWFIGYIDATNIRRLPSVAAAKANEAVEPGGRVWAWAPYGAGFYAREAGFASLDPERSVLEAGDVLVSIPAGLDVTWDMSGLQHVGSVPAGVNLGATITLTYFAGKWPVNGAVDTRPVAEIYRVLRTVRVRPQFQ